MDKELEESLRLGQLKFIFREYARSWFSVKGLSVKAGRQGVRHIIFSNVPDRTKPFARYIDRLADDGWLEKDEGNYRLSEKSMKLLEVTEEDRFRGKLKAGPVLPYRGVRREAVQVPEPQRAAEE